MIRDKQEQNEIIIDLTGPQGNAFYLIGLAKKLAKQLGFDDERIEEMLYDMKTGDYDNLIQEFDDYFGEFVILEK
tara:strand:- start:249 stop:473 length:225 start_codon:yes stop_codon:yes gene_type:complete